jgi:hypothetical protein
MKWIFTFSLSLTPNVKTGTTRKFTSIVEASRPLKLVTTGETGILADIRSASNLRFIPENIELLHVKRFSLLFYYITPFIKVFLGGRSGC